jgi:hypothetical protein
MTIRHPEDAVVYIPETRPEAGSELLRPMAIQEGQTFLTAVFVPSAL